MPIITGKKADFDHDDPYIPAGFLYVESFVDATGETESKKGKMGPGQWSTLGYWDPAGILAAATALVAAALTAAGKRTRVRAATTANITIATALNNGDTLDGVTLATNDLVLVKNQTAQEQNGIYVVGATPARHSEFDTYDEHPGSLIVVEEGTTNADSIWTCTSNLGGTLDTTAIAFTFISSPRTSIEAIVIPCSDETTPIVAATDLTAIPMPYAFVVTEVRAFLTHSNPSGAIFTVDINKNGTTILSTKLTIDNAEGSSTTAATPAVISVPTFADGDIVSIDVDQVGDPGAAGLKVTLIGHKSPL